jgi:hypothetical protein
MHAMLQNEGGTGSDTEEKRSNRRDSMSGLHTLASQQQLQHTGSNFAREVRNSAFGETSSSRQQQQQCHGVHSKSSNAGTESGVISWADVPSAAARTSSDVLMHGAPTHFSRVPSSEDAKNADRRTSMSDAFVHGMSTHFSRVPSTEDAKSVDRRTSMPDAFAHGTPTHFSRVSSSEDAKSVDRGTSMSEAFMNGTPSHFSRVSSSEDAKSVDRRTSMSDAFVHDTITPRGYASLSEGMYACFFFVYVCMYE